MRIGGKSGGGGGGGGNIGRGLLKRNRIKVNSKILVKEFKCIKVVENDIEKTVLHI